MYNKQNFWSPNGYNATNWTVRYIGADGHATDYNASSNREVRPTMNLKSNISISGGTGTTADPYIVNW